VNEQRIAPAPGVRGGDAQLRCGRLFRDRWCPVWSTCVIRPKVVPAVSVEFAGEKRAAMVASPTLQLVAVVMVVVTRQSTGPMIAFAGSRFATPSRWSRRPKSRA
jgi:hypothetical protein